MLQKKENFQIVDTINWFLDSYYRAVGIKVIFIPIKNNFLSTFYTKRYFCEFCKLIQNNPAGEKRCLDNFYNSAEKSSELGFPYIYI